MALRGKGPLQTKTVICTLLDVLAVILFKEIEKNKNKFYTFPASPVQH
jgi:hypothetical protein